jgi:energy-coupling factor transporter ATP-binding protein EcfA2
MSNPFATRYTRPGAIDYLFDRGQSLESLVGRLRDHGWWGAILGPHGSGKSTLLAALTPALETAGRRVVRLMISPVAAEGSGFGVQGSEEKESLTRQRAVAWIQPSEAYQAAADQAPDAALQLVVDGYEQLSWWTRRKIESLCRGREAGLLVTAHQPVGLPVLLTTEPSLALAQQIVERLLPDNDSTVTREDVEAAFTKCGGNLRETLFALFDIYQSRRGS